MSKAFKCNRCGVCFYPGDGYGETTAIKSIYFTTPDDYKECRFTRVLPENNEEYYDLCPDCTADFNRFLSTGPLKKKKRKLNQMRTEE